MPNPICNRRSLGGVRFSPASVAGLDLWLRADRGLFQDTTLSTPALVDTDPVGGWQDFSGQGNHATQGTAGKRGLLKLALVNGQPAVRFDGTDDFMTAPQVALAALTVFIVVRMVTAVANRRVLAHASLNSFYDNTTGNQWAYWDTGTNLGGTDTTTTVLYVRYASLTSATLHLNGGAGTGINPNDAYASQTTIALAAQDSAGLNPANCDIFEVVRYNVLLDAAVALRVAQYLGSRYGVVIT